MILSLQEVIDLLIMTAAVGYIFMDVLQSEPRPWFVYGFDWERFRLACVISAPAIILHEVAHKITAIAFGLKAVFHAAYGWLLVGLVMKMLNTGFIFFVPGYVSIEAIQSPMQSALTAFAGPAVNLLLYLGARIAMAKMPHMKIKTYRVMAMTRQLNGFLFVFNMIPIFGFDGEKVLYGILGNLQS